jgi:hypothetical protein
MNRFILHILSTQTGSFHVFSEYAQIIFNIQKEIIFFTAFKETQSWEQLQSLARAANVLGREVEEVTSSGGQR